AGRSHRVGPGQRDARRHLHRATLPLGQLLHRALVTVDGRGDLGPHPVHRDRAVPGRKKVKVLHVITGLGVGGAELQLRSILQHTRHQSDVVTLYNPGPVAARLAGTPVVVTTEHSIGETHLERRRMTLGVRALYLGTDLCSDATIAVSDAVAHRLTKWGVPARKIELIPNGLDFNRVMFDAAARDKIRDEFSLPHDAYVIGVLGRLDPIKRFDLVIRAAAPLLDEAHRLLIVGDGQIRPELEAEAARHGVADLVTFAGERHDVAAMLSALEALANGIPALYTTCPALDGIETERARQVPGDVEGMRQEIAAEMAGG